MKEINGELSAKGLKIAIAASRFNSFLVEQLVKGAEDAFIRMGGSEKDLTLVRVPGAYELPFVAAKLAATKPDAIVCLGAVVQGATAHADLINQIAQDDDGVVSAESLEQAVERCGTKQGNKGFSAMQAAIETANVAKKL